MFLLYYPLIKYTYVYLIYIAYLSLKLKNGNECTSSQIWKKTEYQIFF